MRDIRNTIKITLKIMRKLNIEKKWPKRYLFLKLTIEVVGKENMDLNYLNRIISSYLITMTWAYVENSNLIRNVFLMKCFY